MSDFQLDNPIEIIKKNIITKFKIEKIDVKPFSNCKVYISLIDENGLFNAFNIEMSSEEYSAWGSDDHYVVNLVKTKLSQMF